MFLENMSGGEKSAFLGLAQELVRADGVLSSKEEELLASLAAMAGHQAAKGTLEDLAGTFQTRKAKVSALLELLGLARVDGEYQTATRAVVAGIAKAFGFGEDELGGMEAWVARQIALIEEAADFWNGEDA